MAFTENEVSHAEEILMAEMDEQFEGYDARLVHMEKVHEDIFRYYFDARYEVRGPLRLIHTDEEIRVIQGTARLSVGQNDAVILARTDEGTYVEVQEVAEVLIHLLEFEAESEADTELVRHYLDTFGPNPFDAAGCPLILAYEDIMPFTFQSDTLYWI